MQKRAMTTLISPKARRRKEEEEEEGEEEEGAESARSRESKSNEKVSSIVAHIRTYCWSLFGVHSALEERCQGCPISCLLVFWELNIANFENSDLDKFQTQLEQLTLIFNLLIQSTSYLRNTWSKSLGLQDYWVKRGELEETWKELRWSPFICCSQTERALKALVMVYASQRMDRHSGEAQEALQEIMAPGRTKHSCFDAVLIWKQSESDCLLSKQTLDRERMSF